MTKREHFIRWVKSRNTRLSTAYNEKEDYFYNGMVDMAYRAWLASPKTRPTEDSKITKEQLADMLKPDPETVVDRLRGIYPGIASPYPVSHLQKEAADEIERLRSELAELEADIEERIDLVQLGGMG